MLWEKYWRLPSEWLESDDLYVFSNSQRFSRDGCFLFREQQLFRGALDKDSSELPYNGGLIAYKSFFFAKNSFQIRGPQIMTFYQ